MTAAIVVAALYVLHQDVWFWRAARPLVFGFLPIGLFYHAAYTLAVSALMAWLVRRHWPADLDTEPSRVASDSTRTSPRSPVASDFSRTSSRSPVVSDFSRTSRVE